MRISEKLPHFVGRHLVGRETLARFLDNSFWLFADQAVRMVAGLSIGVWVTRYLGPEQFGWLSYATAVVTTVGAFTTAGLNAVVVRELVRNPAETDKWLGAAFLLKTLGSAVGFLLCVGLAWIQPSAAGPTRLLVVLVAFGMFFQILDVFDLFFQARGESRISAIVRIAVCLFGSVVKILLILFHGSLLSVAAAGLLELAFAGGVWWWQGMKSGQRISGFRFDWSCLGALLRENWALTVSTFAVYTQAYADQLVIGMMLGGSELGQYAAAFRIVTVFGFVPTIIHTVAAPEITRAKRDDEGLYRRRMYDLYRLMFVLFLATALPIMMIGPLAARLLYGNSYTLAAELLPWLAFRIFFTNMGVARGVFITNEGLFRFALLTALAGAAVNIALNILLVPAWGARGAIASSFVSFGITMFALEYFEPKARTNIQLMARAVFFPWSAFKGKAG